jgi:two-component system, chemotaxis family, sensor kinase Cph1
MSVTDRMPYSLKRDGGTVTDCEAEPIQAPGCIQGHGILIVVRASDLTILQVSENCAEFFDRGPTDLLGQKFETLFRPELVERLRWLLEHEPVERNPLYVATLEPRPRGLTTVSLDLSVHFTQRMTFRKAPAISSKKSRSRRYRTPRVRWRSSCRW